MNSTTGSIEHFAMRLYVEHMIVALPLTILTLKIIVRFVTREPTKALFRSLLVLPLDFIYVAFGLLLAGIARRIPAFVAHYRTDKEADFAGFALCVFLFICACLITWMDRLVRLLWQKFYAAWVVAQELQKQEQQMNLLQPEQQALPEQQTPRRKAGVVYLWMFSYWAMMIPIVFAEVIVSIEALGQILQRLQ